MQTYAFIVRLKNDCSFRNEWIKRRVQNEDLSSIRSPERLLNEFIEALDLSPVINVSGKPVIRISPRRFQGLSCKDLLDIDLKHITTCMALIVDEAAWSIIYGYGIVTVLSSIFGTEYRELINHYIIRAIRKEVGRQDGK